MHHNKAMKWFGSSLIGHVFLIQIIAATPLAIMFIFTTAHEGTLTIGWAVLVYGLCSVLFDIGAALFWYSYSKPRLGDPSR